MKSLLDNLTPGSPDWILARSLDPARLPAHIGVIMDGNGRWANTRNLPRVAGHRAGVDSVRSTVETCAMIGISSLTLYAFSIENWKRPRAEVETLWRLLRHYLRREISNLNENNIQLRAIGRTHALPGNVQAELEAAIAATGGNTGLILNLAINYGGRTEIVDAVNAALEHARRNGALAGFQIDEQTIARHLTTAGQPELDLLIRTSGEMRISNFLLWQVAYAELYVTEKFWPDFNRTALLEALLAFQKRDRRFGGLRTPTGDAAEEHVMEEVGLPIR